MNKEKQIEEMAEIILDVDRSYYGMECDEIQAKAEATAIYDKDFRKASDVAREIFEEIEKLTASVYNDFMFNREGVGMNAHYVVQFSDELDIAIAELKKKYTESEKDK